MKVEVFRVVLLERLEFSLEKDVINGPVAKDHLVIGLVVVAKS